MLVIIVGGIPIAMPTVLSVTLALGAYKLAKEGAIVARMSAVEEMAGMDILCSDKTGVYSVPFFDLLMPPESAFLADSLQVKVAQSDRSAAHPLILAAEQLACAQKSMFSRRAGGCVKITGLSLTLTHTMHCMMLVQSTSHWAVQSMPAIALVNVPVDLSLFCSIERMLRFEHSQMLGLT